MLKTKQAIIGIATIAVAFGFAMTPVIAAADSYTFNTNLTVGSKGTDVMNLQKVLNMSAFQPVLLVTRLQHLVQLQKQLLSSGKRRWELVQLLDS
jgi:hypothetical protein